MSNTDNIIHIDASSQTPLTDDIMKILNAQFIENIRQNRNKLLIDSDKYMLNDFPISPENLILIKQYRQQLRDYMDSIDMSLPLPDFPKFPF